MSSLEFKKICTNLSEWGDTLLIEFGGSQTSNKFVKFMIEGDVANGTFIVKENSVNDEKVIYFK